MRSNELKPAILALAAAALLTACGGPIGGVPLSTTSSTGPEDPVVVSVVVPPGTGEGFEGARSDVLGFECAREESRWRSAGSVVNSTDSPVSYRIYTSFADSGGRTIGVLQVDVDRLEPGASEPWSGTLDLDTSDLECTLRVERTLIP